MSLEPNRLTVGQLRALLAELPASHDDYVVASQCCNSSDCSHVLQSGNFVASGPGNKGATFSLDPSDTWAKARDGIAVKVWRFNVELDYVSPVFSEAEEDDDDA